MRDLTLVGIKKRRCGPILIALQGFRERKQQQKTKQNKQTTTKKQTNKKNNKQISKCTGLLGMYRVTEQYSLCLQKK